MLTTLGLRMAPLLFVAILLICHCHAARETAYSRFVNDTAYAQLREDSTVLLSASTTGDTYSAALADVDASTGDAWQAFLDNCSVTVPPAFQGNGSTGPGANSSLLLSFQYLQYIYNCSAVGTPQYNFWAAEQAANSPNTPLQVFAAGNPDVTTPTSAALRQRFAEFFGTYIISIYWGFANSTEDLLATARDFPEKYPPGPEGGTLLNGQTIAVRYVPSLLTNFLAPFLQPFGVPKTLPVGSITFASVVTFDIAQPKDMAAFLFAGTRISLCQVLTDVNYPLVRYTPPKGLRICPLCQVHQGFYASFLTLLNPDDPNNLYNTWMNVSQNRDPTTVKRVLCGGHSLGAALAQLCGLWAKATFPNAVIEVWQSAAPRVGNPFWAAYFNSYIPLELAPRMVYNRDPIPNLPFAVMPGLKILRPLNFFEHVGQPYWVYREGTQLPGVNWGFKQQRPPLYNDLSRILAQNGQPGGFWYDHLNGYTLSLRQLAENCPPNSNK